MALPAKHAEYEEYSGAIRWIILAAVMLGTLMEVVDTSIVNVSIPQMMGNLGATMDQISWVSTGYIIANVILLPLTGWLSSKFGRKRYLAVSMAIFTVASFLCGVSRSLNMLVLCRILQGAGGAALLSTAQATMMEIFPPSQLGMVQAIYGIGVMVGPTVGPTLGGWITDNYSWPWTFFINIPIGIAAITLVTLFLHDSKHKRANSKVDFVGIGLLAVGLGAMQIVLEKGNREGWFDSSLITSLSVISVVVLVTFVIWELRNPHPAVNLHILKNRGFAAGTVFASVLGFGLYGGTFVLPVFLQQMRSYTAQQTGLIMLPGALTTALVLPITGKLVSKLPARNLVAIGAASFGVSMFMLSHITASTGPEHMFWPLVIRGASMGLLFVPLTLATLMGLKGKDIADGTGFYSLSRQIGGSIGIACMSTYLAHRTVMHRTALVEKINLYSHAALQRIHAYQGFFQSKGASQLTAKKQALQVIDHIVQGEAAIMGFEDVFRAAGLIMIMAIPLLLFFQKGKSVPGKKANIHVE